MALLCCGDNKHLICLWGIGTPLPSGITFPTHIYNFCTALQRGKKISHVDVSSLEEKIYQLTNRGHDLYWDLATLPWEHFYNTLSMGRKFNNSPANSWHQLADIFAF